MFFLSFSQSEFILASSIYIYRLRVHKFSVFESRKPFSLSRAALLSIKRYHKSISDEVVTLVCNV